MSNGTSTPDLSRLISASQATTQAINNLNQSITNLNTTLTNIDTTLTDINTTLGKSLQTTGVASSAGLPTGTYLTIIGPDGNAYAIALLVPA